MTLRMIEREKYNEGKMEMLFKLVKKGLLDISSAVEESSLSLEEFIEEMKKAGY